MTITKTAATLTATQTIYGLQRAQRLEDITKRMGFPVHPALASLEWEDERTDVHGIGCSTHGSRNDQTFVTYTCACGFETGQCPSELDAAADLISHALTTCACCHGPKHPDNFPRCSSCAF
jgi:hypothetical protein